VSRVSDTTSIVLRPARPDEAATLSALALRSKGHWGYSEEFLEACRAELTYAPEDCAAGEVTVAERAGTVLGFAQLTGTDDPRTGEVRAMFVDPPAIGSGVGALLMTAVLDRARDRGLAAVVLDADPGAESFYARFGAARVGESPSGSISGRVLPRLRFAL